MVASRVGLVVLLIAALPAGGAEPQVQKLPVKNVKLGEPGKAGPFTIVALGWRETDDTGWVFPGKPPGPIPADTKHPLIPGIDPKQPMKWVLVDVVGVHTGPGERLFSGRLLGLVDGKGKVATGGLEVLLWDHIGVSAVQPGERNRRTVGFRVPKDFQPHSLLFCNVPLVGPKVEYLPFIPLVGAGAQGPVKEAAALANFVILMADGAITAINATIALDRALGRVEVEAIAVTLGKAGLPAAAAPAKLPGEELPKVARAADGVVQGKLTIRAQPPRRFTGAMKFPAEGRHVAVDFLVDNQEDTPLELVQCDLYLTAADGRRFRSLIPDRYPEDDKSVFRVGARQKATVTLYFDVPADDAALRFRFHKRTDPKATPLFAEVPAR